MHRPTHVRAAAVILAATGWAGWITGIDAASAADDVPMHALRATVKLKDGPRGSTGFLVHLPGTAERPAEIVLVTAAHALESVAGPACTATFRAKGGPAGYERRDVQLVVRDGDAARFVRHPKADVAVIGIVPPDDAECEPFTRAQVADTAQIEAGIVRAGRRTWVACYPAQLETHSAGWPVLRHGTIASHPLLPVSAVPTIYVDYAHFGGDSGAAVVVESEGAAVIAGVVVGMQRQTDRTVSPFEERTMHTSLDLAIAVHPFFITETIDAWIATRR